MKNNILRYADVTLESIDPNQTIEFDAGDTGMQYDYFDSAISGGDRSVEIFRIINQTESIGHVALYRLDFLNRTANIYGTISRNQYYGDFIKALLALLEYAFTNLHLKKLNFVYRQDNYFFDDVCKHLDFVREGLLRGQLSFNEKSVDINVYGMLDYEYKRLSTSTYKRLFAWDYSFNPSVIMYLDLSNQFNRRLFTNSIDNPNHAWINDWLGEYVMNRSFTKDHCLTYKNVKFKVSIFDPETEFDCFSCSNQEVTISDGNYSELLLVTTAQFGFKQTFITAEYTDGSVEECEFTVGDWCDKIVRNEHIIHYAAACRNLGRESNMIKCDAFIYLQRVHINPDKVLHKLIFPKNDDIFIFAGALCGINSH